MLKAKSELVPPVLTAEEAASPLWRKIKAHLEHRLEQTRERNDSPSRGEGQTQFLRGQIHEIKYLAALDKPAPQTEADDDKFKD